MITFYNLQSDTYIGHKDNKIVFQMHASEFSLYEQIMDYFHITLARFDVRLAPWECLNDGSETQELVARTLVKQKKGVVND